MVNRRFFVFGVIVDFYEAVICFTCGLQAPPPSFLMPQFVINIKVAQATP